MLGPRRRFEMSFGMQATMSFEQFHTFFRAVT